MLNCRRCAGEHLLELGRLDVRDYPVFRCRRCGFLFSPPEQDLTMARGGQVEYSAPPHDIADIAGPAPARGLPQRGPAQRVPSRRGPSSAR